MPVVVFDPKAQRLTANCGGRFHQDEVSMSLRVRRLFYVGRFAAIAIVGSMPNPLYLKDILRGLMMAVSRYEKTGAFEIDTDRFYFKEAYGKNQDVEYIIMTKKGLYLNEGLKLSTVDETTLTPFGPLAGVFNVVYAKLQNVADALSYMRNHTAFMSNENISIDREDLRDVIDLDYREKLDNCWWTLP